MKTFHLPDLGEGLPEGEIAKWHVKVGDMIKTDEPLVAIETAKAIVEVPSPYQGKITQLYGKEGDIIPTGNPLVDFELENMPETGTVAGEIKVGNEILTEKAMPLNSRQGGVKVLPAVRALAKKLNVDLTKVHASGVDNTITSEDVKKAADVLSQAGSLEPLRGVRRTMAQAMAQSHEEVVPVTVVDDVDITSWVQEKDFTVKVILAMIYASQKEPSLNAWYDSVAMGRRVIKPLHIGLAIDTPDGLFVPVIKDAQDKNPSQLRQEIEHFKKEIGQRTIQAKELQGATIVLSNFGKFAGRYANPVILPPMVAILGVGSLRQALLPINGQAMLRSVLPLSLTFDHRVVTGGEATRFLGAIMEYLQQGHS